MWDTLNTLWAAHPAVELFLLNFFAAVVILVVGWIISGLLGRSIRRIASRSLLQVDPTIVPMLQVTVVWAVRIFVIIAVLARFGVQTASLIAALSAAGLAIGLALQGTLQNIAAGIMLLALRPLRVGEYVSIVGRADGTVEEIGLFMSRLRQADGIVVNVPNNLIWGNTIINYSRNVTRRMDIAVHVRHGDDLDVAIEALSALVKAHPYVLPDPAPMVMVTAYLESYSAVTIRVWAKTEHYWDLNFDLYRKALLTLREAGMKIPLPLREVHSIPTESLEPAVTLTDQGEKS
ncbi:MAG: mechanosensitive ion channel family protein [Burkholderiaceae bacterium]